MFEMGKERLLKEKEKLETELKKYEAEENEKKRTQNEKKKKFDSATAIYNNRCQLYDIHREPFERFCSMIVRLRNTSPPVDLKKIAKEFNLTEVMELINSTGTPPVKPPQKQDYGL
jgi:hypothetical protein